MYVHIKQRLDDHDLFADSRFTLYLPSVMATATMLHVIHQVEPTNAIHYENQLLAVLKISKVLYST